MKYSNKYFNRINNTFSTLLLLTIFLLFSCNKDEDLKAPIKDVVSDTTINKFIYDNMEFAYFWNTSMRNINNFSEPEPFDFFESLLYPDDGWSFITDDIKSLEDMLKGVYKSKGYSIQPYFYDQETGQVVVFVEYVYPNSPAQNAGLERGDMFYKINNEIITADNYQILLNQDIITITLGYADEDKIEPLLPEIEISAIEGFQSYPIIANEIIEVEDKRIGYLAYTSFISDFDTDLEEVFGKFKNAGISDLILDLRYNGGGSISSATLLASMVCPLSAQGDVFIRENWNDILTNYFKEDKQDTDEIFIERIKSHENNLNLDQLIVLTSSKTASASEMVIYGLAPYMNIIQIGEQTTGKYYGSITISDNPIPDKRKHNWAIQPIVMRSENKDNSIDYHNGLPPTYTLLDQNYNAPLGDPKEHFLAAALELLKTGVFSDQTESLKSLKENYFNPIKTYQSETDPMHGKMYINPK